MGLVVRLNRSLPSAESTGLPSAFHQLTGDSAGRPWVAKLKVYLRPAMVGRTCWMVPLCSASTFEPVSARLETVTTEGTVGATSKLVFTTVQPSTVVPRP